MRILLVDDDAALRVLLRTTFEGADVEVDDADSAASAAAIIERRRPDVIVLDVRMPGMDGFEFCRLLKADRETADIPVMMLTGSDVEGQEEAREAGAEALLRKPFSPLERSRSAPRSRRRGRRRSCSSTRATCATCSSSSAASVPCCSGPTSRR